MAPNAPKHYEMQQNMSLGSIGVDRVHSLWIIPIWLHGMNFCINCTSLAPFSIEFHAVTVWSQMHPNTTKQNKTSVLGPMGWIGCIHCDKFGHDFVARTIALIAHFSSFCTEFHAVTKWSQMHPNTTKRNKRWVWGPMGWIGCVCCENIWRNFVAQTFALIAPVQPILHWVYCRNKTIPNGPKH